MTKYSEIEKNVKPFDLIFFKGGEVISRAIRFIQQSTLGVENKEDVWSHVGIVITRELFDDPRLEPNKVYVGESTLSGRLNDGIKNVDNKSFFGVQIRSLDLLVKKYTTNDKTEIGWSRMKNNPFRDNSKEGLIRQQKIRDQFTIMYPNRWEGIRYDLNIISLVTAVFPFFKPLHWLTQKIDIMNTDDWLFCSEFVFDVLQVFKFYDKRIDSSLVLPNDLLGYDSTSPGIPVIFDDPLVLSL